MLDPAGVLGNPRTDPAAIECGPASAWTAIQPAFHSRAAIDGVDRSTRDGMPRTPAKKLRKAGKHGADKHAAEKHAAGKHAAGKHEAAKPVAKVARKLVAKVDPTKPHAARADSGASTRRPAIQALIRRAQ